MPFEGIQVPVYGDTTPLEQQIINAARKLPPISIKVNHGDFTKALGSITGSSQDFIRSLNAANARVLAFGASAGTLLLIKRGFQELVNTTIEVEKSLTDINVVLQVSTSTLREFSNELFKIAKNTGQPFSEAAKAALEFSRQGLGMEETLKRTRDALILSRQTGLEVAESTNAITAAINSFSKAAYDSTIIISKLAKVDQDFAVSSRDLIEAIKRVGSTAEDSGVSIDQLIGLVTSAQQTTQRGGAVIGQALKTIFTRIERPEVLNQLEEMGVAVRNMNNETLPAITILQNFAKASDGLNSVQKSSANQLIGNVYQINILKAVLKDLDKEYSIYRRAVLDSSSATDQAIQRNERLNQTLAALLNTTKQNATQFASTIGSQSVNPALRKVAETANQILETVNNASTQGDKSSDKWEVFGASIGKGILSGLGQYLSGPGLISVGLVLFKFIKGFAEFAASSVKVVADLNRTAEQRGAIEKRIVQVLAEQPELYQQILSGEVSREEAETRILQIINAQTTALEAQAIISSSLTNSFLAGGKLAVKEKVVTPVQRNAAQGFIPNFVVPAVEKAEIHTAKQAGYLPGKVVQKGNIVYNQAETIKGEAIIPPASKARDKYVQAYKTVHGHDILTSKPNAEYTASEAKWIKSQAQNSGLDISSPDTILSLSKEYRSKNWKWKAKGRVPNFASEEIPDIGSIDDGILHIDSLSKRGEYSKKSPLFKIRQLLKDKKIKTLDAGFIVGPEIPNMIKYLFEKEPAFLKGVTVKGQIDPEGIEGILESQRHSPKAIKKLNEAYKYLGVDATSRDLYKFEKTFAKGSIPSFARAAPSTDQLKEFFNSFINKKEGTFIGQKEPLNFFDFRNSEGANKLSENLSNLFKSYDFHHLDESNQINPYFIGRHLQTNNEGAFHADNFASELDPFYNLAKKFNIPSLEGKKDLLRIVSDIGSKSQDLGIGTQVTQFTQTTAKKILDFSDPSDKKRLYKSLIGKSPEPQIEFDSLSNFTKAVLKKRKIQVSPYSPHLVGDFDVGNSKLQFTLSSRGDISFKEKEGSYSSVTGEGAFTTMRELGKNLKPALWAYKKIKPTGTFGFSGTTESRNKLYRRVLKNAGASLVDDNNFDIPPDFKLRGRGAVPNFAYIPFISPLVGKIATNVTHSGSGFSYSAFKPAIEFIEKYGVKSAVKRVLQDKKLYDLSDLGVKNQKAAFFGSERSEYNLDLSDFAFRKMFGLKPRIDPAPGVKLREIPGRKNTYALGGKKANTKMSSDILNAIHDTNRINRVSPTQITALGGNLDFGNFDIKANPKTGQIRYSDTWDFALHGDEPLDIKAAFKEIKGRFINQKAVKNWWDGIRSLRHSDPGEAVKQVQKSFNGSTLKNLFHDASETTNALVNGEYVDSPSSSSIHTSYQDTNLTRLMRKVVGYVSSPITFVGQLPHDFSPINDGRRKGGVGTSNKTIIKRFEEIIETKEDGQIRENAYKLSSEYADLINYKIKGKFSDLKLNLLSRLGDGEGIRAMSSYPPLPKESNLPEFLKKTPGKPFSRGRVPNFASLIGEGMFGKFFDLEKVEQNLPVGMKVFEKHVADSVIQKEFVMAKKLEDIKINPLFKFPKTYDDVEKTLQRRGIKKEIIKGSTPLQIAKNNLDMMFSEGTQESRVARLSEGLNKVAVRNLGDNGITAADLAYNVKNSIFNPSLASTIDKISSKEKQAEKLIKQLDEPEKAKRIATALARKGGQIGIIDPGNFYPSNNLFGARGSVPNYADPANEAFKKLYGKDFNFGRNTFQKEWFKAKLPKDQLNNPEVILKLAKEFRESYGSHQGMLLLARGKIPNFGLLENLKNYSLSIGATGLLGSTILGGTIYSNQQSKLQSENFAKLPLLTLSSTNNLSPEDVKLIEKVNSNPTLKAIQLRNKDTNSVPVSFVDDKSHPGYGGQYRPYSGKNNPFPGSIEANKSFVENREGTLYHEYAHYLDMTGKLGLSVRDIQNSIEKDKKKLGTYFNKKVGISISGNSYKETFAEIIAKGLTKDYQFDKTNDIRKLDLYSTLQKNGFLPKSSGHIPNFASLSLSAGKRILKLAEENYIKIYRGGSSPLYDFDIRTAFIPKGSSLDTVAHEVGHGLSSVDLYRPPSSIKMEQLANQAALENLSGKDAEIYKENLLAPFKTYKHTKLFNILSQDLPSEEQNRYIKEYRQRVGNEKKLRPKEYTSVVKAQAQTNRELIKNLGIDVVKAKLANLSEQDRTDLRTPAFSKGLVPNFASIEELMKQHGITKDEYSTLKRYFQVGKTLMQAEINSVESISFQPPTGNSRSKTNEGAFKTIAELKKALPPLIEVFKKENPESPLSFIAASDNEKNTRKKLYERSLKQQGIQPNNITSYFSQFDVPENFKFKSKGQVPNFADGLGAAISREISAGVSPALVKVGNDPSLVNSGNPFGLGVFNKRDEPAGLKQGINRAVREGKFPQTYGLAKGFVPNYAPLRGSTSLLTNAGVSEGVITNLNEYYKKLTENLVSQNIAVQNLTSEANKVISAMRLQTQGMKLNAEVLDKYNKGVEQSIAGIVADIQNKRPSTPLKTAGQAAQPEVEKAKIDIENKAAVDAKNKEFKKFGVSNFLKERADNKAEELNEAIRLKNQADSAAYFVKELYAEKVHISKQNEGIRRTRVLNELKASVTPPPQLLQVARGLGDLHRTEEPEYGSVYKIKPGLVQPPPDESFFEKLKRTFNSPIGGSPPVPPNLPPGFRPFGEFDPNNPEKPSRFERAKSFIKGTNLSPADRKSRNERLQQTAFLAQIVAPVTAGVIQQAIGDETPKQRGYSSAVGTLGNAVSFAGLGATVGGPIGGIVGFGVGAWLGVKETATAFNDTLPELQRNLDKTRETVTKMNDGFSKFISIGEQIEEIAANPREGYSRDLARLRTEQAKSLLSIPNSKGRAELLGAYASGDIGQQVATQEKYSVLASQRLSGLAITEQLETAKKAGGKTITPQIESSYSSLQNEVLGVSNKEGKTFDEFLQDNEDVFKRIKSAAGTDKLLPTVENELKRFSPEQYRNLAPAFTAVQKTAGGIYSDDNKRISEGFSNNFLKDRSLSDNRLEKGLRDASNERIAQVQKNLLTFADAVFQARERISEFTSKVSGTIGVLNAQIVGSGERNKLVQQGLVTNNASFFTPEDALKIRQSLEIPAIRKEGEQQQQILQNSFIEKSVANLGQEQNKILEQFQSFNEQKAGQIATSLKSDAFKSVSAFNLLAEGGKVPKPEDIRDVAQDFVRQLVAVNIPIERGALATGREKIIQGGAESVAAGYNRDLLEFQNNTRLLNENTKQQVQTALIRQKFETDALNLQRRQEFGGGIQNLLSTDLSFQTKQIGAGAVAGRALNDSLFIGQSAFNQANLLKSLNIAVPPELIEKIAKAIEGNLSGPNFQVDDKHQALIRENLAQQFPSQNRINDVANIKSVFENLQEKDRSAAVKSYENIDLTRAAVTEIAKLASNEGLLVKLVGVNSETGKVNIPTLKDISVKNDYILKPEEITAAEKKLKEAIGKKNRLQTSYSNFEAPQEEEGIGDKILRLYKNSPLKGLTDGLASYPGNKQLINLLQGGVTPIENSPYADKKSSLLNKADKEVNTANKNLNDLLEKAFTATIKEFGDEIEKSFQLPKAKANGDKGPTRFDREAADIRQKALADAEFRTNELETVRKKGAPDTEAVPTGNGLKIPDRRTGFNANTTVQRANQRLSQEDQFIGDSFLNKQVGAAATAAAGLWNTADDQLKDLQRTILDTASTFRSAFKDAAAQMITGAKSVSDAFREMGLNIANRFLSNVAGNGVDTLLGLVGSSTGLNNVANSGSSSILSGLASYFKTSAAKGGYIPKFATGGIVKGGSGTKDDVLANLQGGEFVINKESAQAIGYGNLQTLNDTAQAGAGPGSNPSTLTATSNTLQASLQDAYIYTGNTLQPTGGKAVTDPRLSSYALTDDNNPQNNLRLERESILEKFLLDKKNYDKYKHDTERNFQNQVWTKFGTTIFSAASAAYNSYGSSSNTASIAKLAGQTLNYGGQGANGLDQYGKPIDLTNYYGTDTPAGTHARGGYIPLLGNGGRNTAPNALLMGGEFMFSPQATQRIGVDKLNGLNSVRKYASGGLVGANPSSISANSESFSGQLDKLIKINESIRDSIQDTQGTQPVNAPKENAQGAANTNNVSVNITINNTQPQQQAQVSGTVQTDPNNNNNKKQASKEDQERYQKFGKLMHDKAIEVIVEQQRPGGLLYESKSRGGG